MFGFYAHALFKNVVKRLSEFMWGLSSLSLINQVDIFQTDSLFSMIFILSVTILQLHLNKETLSRVFYTKKTVTLEDIHLGFCLKC